MHLEHVAVLVSKRPQVVIFNWMIKSTGLLGILY
jgi:hypothetical protein